MDTAVAAAQADPVHNLHFRRRWAEPPDKRQRPGGRGNDPARAEIEGDSSALDNIHQAPVAQRGIAAARRRADQLSDRAVLLAAIGERAAALRMAALAIELREVAA